MNSTIYSANSRILHALTLAISIFVLTQAKGQVTVTSNPANGATGVSPSASVVFTFSAAVDPSSTSAAFYSLNPPGSYPVTMSWNNTSTTLTCAPITPFPNNATITWFVGGSDSLGNSFSGTGSFTTGSGGGGGTGTGTNAITTFTAGKAVLYDQSSAAVPVLDPTTPYLFNALTALASNRTATSITLTLPSGSVSNLTQNLFRHEDWNLLYYTTSASTFDATFPQGTYTFFVSATASNQTVVDVLPSGMTQPNAPHLTNYVAAQSVDPTKPFTLYWDAFSGGATTDYVYVVVGNNVWQTANPGTGGALNGLATSVTIPANTLLANSNYDCSIGFYHSIWSSNATYAVGGYRASVTHFTLSTFSSAPAPVLKNGAWNGGSFSFDIDTASGQTVTVLTSSNLTQWSAWYTTNSPGTVHITDSRPPTNSALFYRARNGT